VVGPLSHQIEHPVRDVITDGFDRRLRAEAADSLRILDHEIRGSEQEEKM
jgi:hypothetical protein